MDPRTDYKNPFAGAITELMSAMSALNMEPSPLENPTGTYLTDTDYYVRHSYDHMRAAMKSMEKSQEFFETILREVEYHLDLDHDISPTVEQFESWLKEGNEIGHCKWIMEQFAELRKKTKTTTP